MAVICISQQSPENTIELPEWLLAMAYMAIGWRIGLGFDKQCMNDFPGALADIQSAIRLNPGDPTYPAEEASGGNDNRATRS